MRACVRAYCVFAGVCVCARARAACVRVQDFTPHIHLTESDFAAITAGGALCDAAGDLGPREFEEAMRRQEHIY